MQPVRLQAFASHASCSTAFVVNRALHKDPEQRYQSYDEVIEHLEYALTDSRSNAAQGEAVVLEAAISQKTWGWVTAAMLGIIVAVGIGYFLHGGNQAWVGPSLTFCTPEYNS